FHAPAEKPRTWPGSAGFGMPAPMHRTCALIAGVALAALFGCDAGQESPSREGVVSLDAPAPQAAEEKKLDPAMEPKAGGPRLGAVAMAAPIYLKADRRSAKIGYLRAGATVVRGEKPVAFD